jgi:hypothetical protein
MSFSTTRPIFWTAWAHIANDYAWNLSWGGPYGIIPSQI